MIAGNNCDAASYRGIDPLLDRALELLNDDFLFSVPADTVKIDGDKLYATLNEYVTAPFEETFYEAHRRYLDIHVLIQGEERMDISSPAVLTEREHSGDFYAYTGDSKEQTVELRPGKFLVVFPHDAHRVRMQLNGPSNVKKVVFKILYE